MTETQTLQELFNKCHLWWRMITTNHYNTNDYHIYDYHVMKYNHYYIKYNRLKMLSDKF